ncbi:MAG: P-II family nitrogen regulator [Dehalococcoidia bacterium]
MKRIEAIIRPEKILDVKAALERLGYGGMTVTEVKGHGTQRGIKEEWNGKEFWIEFLPKLWFLMVVDDKDVDEVVDAICENAVTGEPGDGKVFVSDIIDAVRVRTRERGVAALTGGTPVVTPGAG